MSRAVRASAPTRRPGPLVGVLHSQQLAEMQANANRVSDVLKAIANGARLMLVCQLAEGEKSVGELQSIIGLGQSALSQHLAVLRHEGLVAFRREGQTIHYRLSGREVDAVLTTLYDLYCGSDAAPQPVRRKEPLRAKRQKS